MISLMSKLNYQQMSVKKSDFRINLKGMLTELT